MPRYIYGSLCVRVGKLFDLYVMFCDWMYALKFEGVRFNFCLVKAPCDGTY